MKHPVIWHIVLALSWAAITGDFRFSNVLVGFVVGYLAIVLAGPEPWAGGYGRRLIDILAFAGFYVVELAISTFKVAYDVLTPAPRSRPAVIAIPLEEQSDGQLTLLANLISMTPGTLSLDVSRDKRTLFIHCMFVDDPDAFRSKIKQDFERRVLKVTS